MLITNTHNITGGVITRDELAVLLRVSTYTIDRMHLSGIGPKRMRLSRRRVGYHLHDVNAWLKAQFGEGTTNAQ